MIETVSPTLQICHEEIAKKHGLRRDWMFSSDGKNGIMHQDIYIYCHAVL
jgi:hypothetical protein